MSYAVQVVAKPPLDMIDERITYNGWEGITEWEFDSIEDARELFDKVQNIIYQMYPWLGEYEQVEAYLWDDETDNVEIKRL